MHDSCFSEEARWEGIKAHFAQHAVTKEEVEYVSKMIKREIDSFKLYEQIKLQEISIKQLEAEILRSNKEGENHG